MPYAIALREEYNQGPELPERYDRVRPHYPDVLFDALIEATRLPAGAKLLEIGPGPGTATEPLADRGRDITAVEMSPPMAEIARDRLRCYPKTHVVTGALETTPLPQSAFDLVFSATALHWVKRANRFRKPHRLLKPGGHLAIIHANHLTDGRGDAFYKATQPIYKRLAPGTNLNQANLNATPRKNLPEKKDLRPFKVSKRLFKQVYFEVFQMIKPFSAEEYVELLSTFPTTLAMPDDKRQKFLSEIGGLIDKDFGGQVSLNYGMSLTIARRRRSLKELIKPGHVT